MRPRARLLALMLAAAATTLPARAGTEVVQELTAEALYYPAAVEMRIATGASQPIEVAALGVVTCPGCDLICYGPGEPAECELRDFHWAPGLPAVVAATPDHMFFDGVMADEDGHQCGFTFLATVAQETSRSVAAGADGARAHRVSQGSASGDASLVHESLRSQVVPPTSTCRWPLYTDDRYNATIVTRVEAS